jgi:hypothetical protein
MIDIVVHETRPPAARLIISVEAGGATGAHAVLVSCRDGR